MHAVISFLVLEFEKSIQSLCVRNEEFHCSNMASHDLLPNWFLQPSPTKTQKKQNKSLYNADVYLFN